MSRIMTMVRQRKKRRFDVQIVGFTPGRRDSWNNQCIDQRQSAVCTSKKKKKSRRISNLRPVPVTNIRRTSYHLLVVEWYRNHKPLGPWLCIMYSCYPVRSWVWNIPIWKKISKPSKMRERKSKWAKLMLPYNIQKLLLPIFAKHVLRDFCTCMGNTMLSVTRTSFITQTKALLSKLYKQKWYYGSLSCRPFLPEVQLRMGTSKPRSNYPSRGSVERILLAMLLLWRIS